MLFKKTSKDAEAAAAAGQAAAAPDAAIRDELGLHRRWYFTMRLAEEMNRASRKDRSLAVAVWEIRLLPGESPSPEAIHQTASLLVNRLRSYDLVLRLDGGRFLAMLLDVSREEAMTAAFRLKADLSLAIRDGKWRAGVAAFPGDAVDPDALVNTAIRRLEEDVNR